MGSKLVHRLLTQFLLGHVVCLHLTWVTHAEEPAGKVVNVSGKVLVRRDEGTGATSSAKNGDSVFKRSVINTSSDGSVKLLMSDKSILDIGPSTLFKVDDYQLKNGSDRVVSMSIDYGKVRASVTTPVGNKGKFTVRTKSATMGVRGTEFVVFSDLATAMKPIVAPAGEAAQPGNTPPPSDTGKGKTQITVIHGKVEVTSDKKEGGKTETVSLTDGSQLTATTTATQDGKEKTETQKVVKLEAQELKAVQKDAKQQDKTFTQAVVIDRSSDKKGNQTMAALSEGFTLPKDFIPKIGEMGFIGTFGGDFGVRNTFRPDNSASVTLKVVVNK